MTQEGAFMYHARHRRAANRGKLCARLAVPVLVAPLFVLPAVGIAQAESNLACTAFSADAMIQAACSDYSKILSDTMATLVPGSEETFAAELAAGMAVAGPDGTKTLQCELDVTCDAFPVTMEIVRIQTGHDLTSCASAGTDPCAAYSVMSSPEITAEVATASARFIAELETSPLAERYVRVSPSIRHALDRLGGVASPEPIADALVALIVLAYQAIPADSLTSGITPPGGVMPLAGEGSGELSACGDTGIVKIAGTGGVESSVAVRFAHAVLLCADLDLVDLATSKKVTCAARAEYFATLETHSNDWDNRLFDLEAEHGIQNLNITPSVAGYKCPTTSIKFNGTIYEEMHSNAGSWASNSETSGTPRTQYGVLYPYPAWMPVDVNVYWTHNKVTTTHGPFWIDYTVHFWSPPGGNYDSYGTARLELTNKYKFHDGKSVHNAEVHCTQKGNPTECEFHGY